ncbi:MAG TPA: hypothetical protein ENJ19_01920 [Gammaproteobacteria bacterium]|nr:hypothetical protein [Gammaproteobacteria bacterium]
MDYKANLDTVKIYLATGLTERAREYLQKILSGTPEAQRRAADPVYLKAVALSARLCLEEEDRQGGAAHIEHGLSLKPDHADLLFMKALIYWDIQRFDEMFVVLVAFLAAVTAADAEQYDYQYAAQPVLSDVVYKLLPEAFDKATSRTALAEVVQKAAAVSHSDLIQTVHTVLFSRKPTAGAAP